MRTVRQSHPTNPPPPAFAARAGGAAGAQARGDHTIDAFLDRFNPTDTGRLSAWGPNVDPAAAANAYLDGLVRAAQDSLQAREPRPREALIKAAYQILNDDEGAGNPRPIGSAEPSDKVKGGVGGNPHRIGSTDWLKMGKRDGVWFPFPAPQMKALELRLNRGELDAPADWMLEALACYADYLKVAGGGREVEFWLLRNRDAIKSEVEQLKLPQDPKQRHRVLMAQLHEHAEKLFTRSKVNGEFSDTHGELARLGEVLVDPHRGSYVRDFKRVVEDGWVEACQMMSELVDDASPEQLAAVAKEAMKPKRLNIRVQHTGKEGEIDGGGNVKASEYNYSLHRDLPTAAASLFWVHLRIGDKDWSAGNVWQALSSPGVNIGLMLGSLRDPRSAQNMRALNGAQLTSMRSVAKELGFEVYDSKAKASEDVAHALRRFREENRAGLMRLAMDHPAHFAKLQEAMLAIVRAAAEGKEVLQKRLDGWLPNQPGTASAGLEPSRSGP